MPELPHEDTRPAYEDLGELTDGLPPKERAAVVLRYGYDLTYDQIAAALDSSPDAARQAASTGVRRLRKEQTRMTVPTDLDRRFRDAAARSGMLDAGYDLVDSPLGRAARRRDATAGSCGSRSTRISTQQLEWLSRRRRPPRAPVAAPGRPGAPRARRVLRGPPPGVRPRRRPARRDAVHASACCTSSRGSRSARRRRTRELAERAGNPKAARAVGTIMNRNPIPIVLPCHRVIGANGSLVGYAGGLERKVALLTLEGVLL